MYELEVVLANSGRTCEGAAKARGAGVLLVGGGASAAGSQGAGGTQTELASRALVGGPPTSELILCESPS